MWVSQDEWVFEAEKGKLADLLNRGLIDQSTVLGITVGSETVYREEVTVDQIVDYHNQVKGILANEGITNLPVAITEPAPVYSKEAQLRTEVDLIYTNIFPFWENIPIDAALADLQEDINWILNLPESQGKDFILGETGWPSDGLIEGIQPGTPENQAQYFVDFYCKIDKELNWKYYWFTAIDNSWRREQDPENFVEGNFGFLQGKCDERSLIRLHIFLAPLTSILYEPLKDDLTLKPFFKDLTFTCSNGIEYSFSETDWTIPIVTAAPAPVPLNSCQVCCVSKMPKYR
jgi:exo-beta-1,3-glucanase (GH17 family)